MGYLSSSAPSVVPGSGQASNIDNISMTTNPYSYLQEVMSGENSEGSTLSSSSDSIQNTTDERGPAEDTPPTSPDPSLTSQLPQILASFERERSENAPSLETKLKQCWNFWYIRPPEGLKSTQLNYESLLRSIGKIETIGDFWSIYLTLKRPDDFSTGTVDFSFFKEGIRPIWEDSANEHGGKLVIRIKKKSSISTRMWEYLLLALLSDELDDIQDAINGVMFSLRPYENFISVWTPNSDDHPQIQSLRYFITRLFNYRDRIRSFFGFPQATLLEYKTHNYNKSTSQDLTPHNMAIESGPA